MQKNLFQKICDFSGLKNNPFYSKELKGPWLELFVNRKDELEETEWFIASGRTVAICSKQGIGKSSFLSYMNERVLPETDLLSAKFNFDFEKVEGNEFMIFLRKILRELLFLFAKHKDDYPALQNIDFEFESARLEKTITLEENIKRNFGGKIGIEADFNKVAKLFHPVLVNNGGLPKVSAGLGGDGGRESKTITQIPIHNNETVKDKIIELGKLYDGPVVFFIDELDKTGKLFQDSFEWSKEIYKLLRHCREIFETSNFIFVFSLDYVFYEKMIEANREGKNIDILGIIEKFVNLDPFTLKEFEAALIKRFEFAEAENPQQFFDKGKIKLLYSFTMGNSRLFMSWYEDILYQSYRKKNKNINYNSFFDIFEKKLGYDFSKNIRKFLIELAENESAKLHTVTKEDMKIFIDSKYIIEDNGIYILNSYKKAY